MHSFRFNQVFQFAGNDVIVLSQASKQAYSIKRHEETEKWNEMKDEQKYEMELI